jgi:hypothetical protein
MYFTRIFKLLVLLLVAFAPCKAQHQNFNKQAFYKVLAANNITDIDNELQQITTTTMPEKLAYEAVLLMKKSGLVAKVKEKLHLFKQGRTKMEAAIENDKVNTEYRFLRLIIQENAPNIVKYKSDLQNDSNFITTNFGTLSPLLQQIIKDYSKRSKVLKTPVNK